MAEKLDLDALEAEHTPYAHDLGSSETICRLITRLRALESASQPGSGEAWQPIETAPKDREVWAFNGEQARMIWSQGYADNGEGWALWVWCDELLSDADPEPEQPTHWMPLPAAPSAGNGEAKGER